MDDPIESRSALFVDLDGTLIERAELPDPGAPLRFLPGAREALVAIRDGGFAIVVVTNQSGLALGQFTRSQFLGREATLQWRLRDEAQLVLAAILVCPHRPGRYGAPACLCRMPAPGLLIRAARTHRFDLAASWIVGSALDQVESGRRAGCRTALLTGVPADAEAVVPLRWSSLRTPHRRCEGWADVARAVLELPRAMAARWRGAELAGR